MKFCVYIYDFMTQDGDFICVELLPRARKGVAKMPWNWNWKKVRLPSQLPKHGGIFTCRTFQNCNQSSSILLWSSKSQ
jgi:hypothetical protein